MCCFVCKYTHAYIQWVNFSFQWPKKKKLRNSHAENPFLNYVQYKVMFEVPVRRLLSNSKFLQPGLCKVKKKKMLLNKLFLEQGFPKAEGLISCAKSRRISL